MHVYIRAISSRGEKSSLATRSFREVLFFRFSVYIAMHGRHSSAPRRLFVTVERNGHGIHCFVLFCPTSFPLHLVSHILYVCVYACVRACAHECVCPVDSSLRVCGACGHRSSSGKSGREGGGSDGGKGPRGGGGSVYEVGIMKRGFGGKGRCLFLSLFWLVRGSNARRVAILGSWFWEGEGSSVVADMRSRKSGPDPDWVLGFASAMVQRSS